MTKLNIEELTKTAEAYEQLLVPALFGEWVDRLADAAEIRPGQQVLDVACGTGVLARAIAERTGHARAVSGVDINPAMLAVAKRISPEIDWREGSAESLPFEKETFDAVVSQFGLMLFRSPEIALREMMRVLKTGGRLVVGIFDSLDNLPAYAAIAEVYDRLVDKAVGDALRIPFSMGANELASCFAAAGIGTSVMTSHEGRARFPDAMAMVLADVRGWFPFARIHLDEETLEAVVKEAAKVIEPFRTNDGAVVFRVPVNIVTATKP